MKPLTKRHIQKILSAPIDVRLINGVFNKVSVYATCNRRKFGVEVDVIHPFFVDHRSVNKEIDVMFVDENSIKNASDIPTPPLS